MTRLLYICRWILAVKGRHVFDSNDLIGWNYIPRSVCIRELESPFRKSISSFLNLHRLIPKFLTISLHKYEKNTMKFPAALLHCKWYQLEQIHFNESLRLIPNRSFSKWRILHQLLIMVLQIITTGIIYFFTKKHSYVIPKQIKVHSEPLLGKYPFNPSHS